MKLPKLLIIGKRPLRVICTKGFFFEPYGKRVDEGSIFDLTYSPFAIKGFRDTFVLVRREETHLEWLYISREAVESHFELLPEKEEVDETVHL